MAVVIHTIKGNDYAYEHHRVGSKVVCDYLGRAGGDGGTNMGTQIYQEIKTTAPEVTQHERQSQYGNKLKLKKVSDSNGIQIWASPKATQSQIDQIKNMAARQPASIRSTVEHIEVYGDDDGQKFKVGEVEFTAGGHWSQKIEGDETRKENVIRIFGEQGERLLYHESGHSLYTKLNQDALKETYSYDISNRIYDKVTQHRDNKVKEIRSKYKPLKEEQMEKMDKAYEVSTSGVFDRMWSPEGKEKQKELNKVYDKERRKIIKLEKQEQKEIEELRTRFNPDVATEKYRALKAPTQQKLRRFSEASWKEGGISEYTRSYEKANSSSFVDENFAESTNLFLGGLTRDVEQYRTKYPETWSAYRNIVEPQIVGAFTEVKLKPKGDEWLL